MGWGGGAWEDGDGLDRGRGRAAMECTTRRGFSACSPSSRIFSDLHPDYRNHTHLDIPSTVLSLVLVVILNLFTSKSRLLVPVDLEPSPTDFHALKFVLQVNSQTLHLDNIQRGAPGCDPCLLSVTKRCRDGQERRPCVQNF